MKVRDVMTKTAVSCRSEMSLAAAGALMWENDCGLLPIVNDSGKVTGVITDRDICIALSTRDNKPSQLTTGEVAKPPAVICLLDDDIHSALKTMSKERIHRLPVVNGDGGLVGILSINDLVLRAEKGDGRKPEISYDDVVRAFQAICAHPTGTTHAAAA
jgi:CBS domain-containing protein